MSDNNTDDTIRLHGPHAGLKAVLCLLFFGAGLVIFIIKFGFPPEGLKPWLLMAGAAFFILFSAFILLTALRCPYPLIATADEVVLKHVFQREERIPWADIEATFPPCVPGVFPIRLRSGAMKVVRIELSTEAEKEEFGQFLQLAAAMGVKLEQEDYHGN